VLRRPVGGAAAMAEQIRWLLALARRPTISIRVVPFRRGGYHNPGRFALLRFRDESPLVYFEHEGSSGFLDERGPVATFDAIAEAITAAAVDDHESVNLMARIAADHERG
jgi:hypothetical protein